MFISLLLIALCGFHSGHALSMDLTDQDGLPGDINISPDVRSEQQLIAEIDKYIILKVGPRCTRRRCCPYYMYCCQNNLFCCKPHFPPIRTSQSYC
ncbi:unnamed protein product [Nezara viridula]|uniref:Neuropeptide n=1 Tax=Nezara viridula TaxID=85310 RepID=A0A9P0DYU5_NEZVI|nr:unnamed protein product [Nezara viridula]